MPPRPPSRRLLLAILQGIGAALALHGLVFAGRAVLLPAPPQALDERAGRIREVLVHLDPEAQFARPAYESFFRQAPAGLRIWVACERLEDAAELERWTGRRVTPVPIGKRITTWARDRFVACSDGSLVVPPEPQPGGSARRNDWEVPFALARLRGDQARPATFRFDGGDFLAADGRLFATSTWIGRNPERTAAELLETAVRFFRQPLVVLPEAPAHHIGMALASVGRDRFLVGDVRWGRRLAPASLDVDEREETAGLFDAMAERLAKEGFRVDRIPVAPTRREFVWVTYTNGLFEDGVVYLPTYGLGALDEAAAAVYRSLEYEVRPVDVGRVYEHGGTLHCLVHVLRRDP